VYLTLGNVKQLEVSPAPHPKLCGILSHHTAFKSLGLVGLPNVHNVILFKIMVSVNWLTSYRLGDSNQATTKGYCPSVGLFFL